MTSVTDGGPSSLSGQDPRTYQRHPLHGDGRVYLETNCYTDILIELLHARGYEPLAALGHLVRMDFEGDQWTFFKPPAHDLERLYGVDIHEMQPYRPLPLQIAEQLAAGRTLIVEVDSFYLPDTAATDYRRAHVKTSVAAEGIDIDTEVLRYFHNAGLYELAGEDYRGLFRLGESVPEALPGYAELVRFDAGPPLDDHALRRVAGELLHHHLARRPRENPFVAFGAQLAGVLPALLEGGLDDFHAYAFATVRMAGAAFELAGSHVEWLLGDAAAPALTPLAEIVGGCKTLSFRLARRKPFDPEPRIAELAGAWEAAMATLDEVAG
jgi:hypothetical protein